MPPHLQRGVHREDRVLCFFSSRPNWDHPHHPQPSVSPFGFGGGGTYSLAGEGVGGSQFGRGDRQCGTLGIYVLFGGVAPHRLYIAGSRQLPAVVYSVEFIHKNVAYEFLHEFATPNISCCAALDYTISYLPIENSFNGCQGHPLVCLPPGTAQRQRTRK
jgi:hypothetical protein